jgi:hypothetical protein
MTGSKVPQLNLCNICLARPGTVELGKLSTGSHSLMTGRSTSCVLERTYRRRSSPSTSGIMTSCTAARCHETMQLLRCWHELHAYRQDELEGARH